MRGIGLTTATVLLILMLSIPMLQAVELYSMREEILRTDVESHLKMVDVEILKRVLVSDLLCKLDLHLSKGTLYPLSTTPDEIVMPAVRSWKSSLSIESERFDEHVELFVSPGVAGRLVFDGGGYPMTLHVKIRLTGPRSAVSADDAISVRHTAKIFEARERTIYYRDLLLEMIREKVKENASMSFEYEALEGDMDVYLRAWGGPEVYRYEVVVKDRGRGAVLDLRLDYGFRASGVVRNEPPDQATGFADRVY